MAVSSSHTFSKLASDTVFTRLNLKKKVLNSDSETFIILEGLLLDNTKRSPN